MDAGNTDKPLDHQLVARDPSRYGLTRRDGEYWIEGVPLSVVAREVGTPTYVYGRAHVEERYRGLVKSLAGRRHTVCYAVKANSNQAVLRTLARLGTGADIVSVGEMKRALAAGIPASKIVFSGVGKRSDEIDAALDSRIRSINAESAEEVEQIAARAAASGTVAPVSLRVNPDVDPDTHPYLATGLREAKFGISMENTAAVASSVVANPNLELVGITCHIGSQIMDARPFLDSVERLRRLLPALRDAGAQLRYLDVGGGLGIPYGAEDPAVDVQSWGSALADATADLDVELMLEPGRYLVGNAGVLLTRVLVRKRGEERDFVVVDAAMNDLLRPALYGAYHALTPVRAVWTGVEVRTADIVGPVCECGDFLAQGRQVPWPETGDLFAVCSAGAYGMTMASTYNTRPIAAEVLVDGDRYAVVRPRKTVEDLVAEDRVPDWLA